MSNSCRLEARFRIRMLTRKTSQPLISSTLERRDASRLRLSWGMKTWKLFLLPVLEMFEFGCQIPYGQKTRRGPNPLSKADSSF
jgi:hypothetical protein